jgi:tRNA(Glu) U13 pseudouridine synthase TruD
VDRYGIMRPIQVQGVTRLDWKTKTDWCVVVLLDSLRDNSFFASAISHPVTFHTRRVGYTGT